MNDIINNSYIIGIGTRNLVLNTLGRIYIKVKDRYYEFDFRKQFGEEISIPNIIIVKNEQEVSNLTYPGDNKLIISEDGKIWITQNKKIQPIHFEINQESLTLNELTVNGQITINTTYDDNLEENPPFIINTQKLIENLNAQFLNGIEADQFAIKNNNEFITGEWNFNSFNVSNSITSSNNNMVIDFLNNKITVCDLEVTCNAKLPSNVGSNQNELGNYSGFKNRTYFGREFKFSEFNVIDVYYFDVLDFINYAYNIQYLDNYVNENSIDLDDWVNVFVSYNDEDGVELIDIENNKSIANEKLVEMGIVTKTIDDYSLLWTNLQEVNQTGYDGDIYELIIPNFEYIPFGTILPGDVVILNVSGKAAKILSISDKNVIIKLKSEEDYINDDKIIRISENGATYIQSIGEHTPYLEVTDKNNKTKVRIGTLTGIKEDGLDDNGIWMDHPHIRNIELKDGIISNTELHDSIINNSNFKYNADNSGNIGDKISWTSDGKVNIDFSSLEKKIEHITMQNEVVNTNADIIYVTLSSYQDIPNEIHIKPYSLLYIKNVSPIDNDIRIYIGQDSLKTIGFTSLNKVKIFYAMEETWLELTSLII